MTEANILIVEDEAIVVADLASKLRHLGYTVCASAARGEDALALTFAHHPQLVLMDIRLAGEMDGVEAAERIHRECDVPVIFVTEHADRAMLERVKLSEPFDYLTKPFEECELQTHIEMALYKRQAERRLREHEEWLRVTLSCIGDAVIAGDTAGRVTFLNPVAAALTGWAPSEALGQPVARVFQIVNELTHVPSDDLVARVLRENRIIELANHTALITRDGREVPVEDSAAPITDPSGRVTGVVIVFHDVTEKRRAEEALRESEARFRAAFDQGALAMNISGPDERLLQVNAAFTRMLGYDEAEMLGRSFNDFTHPADIVPNRAGVQRLLRREIPVFRMEKRYLRQDGGIVWVDMSTSAVRDAGGDLRYFVTHAVDITERKAAEAERERLQEQMQTFVHLVSHDLRAPLTITDGHLNLLQDALTRQEIPAMQTSIDAIARSAKRMNTMIDDLSMAARLEGGQLKLTRTALDFSDWLPTFLTRSARALEVHRVRHDLPLTMPAITADADRLERILTNLLSNALKYSDPATPVWLQAQPRDGELLILVKDQGQGIAPTELPHLFEKFYRAGSSRKAEGIGLGLYITRLLVEIHGGRVWAESEEGKGSTFAFTLPIGD